MRFFLPLSSSVLLLFSSAQAQLWNSAPETARQPILRGFTPQGTTLTRAGASLTFDTVAGHVVGVQIEAPLADTEAVARGILASWGSQNEKGVAKVKLMLDDSAFQARARTGMLSVTSDEGTHVLGLKISGQGNAAKWQIYSALNVLPESTFPKTKNVTGSTSAPGRIHVLSDFQCPACLNLWRTRMPDWRAQPQNYRIAYHHFPLPYHKNAFAAAEASECAAQQGQFWAFADQLFGNYTAWIRQPATEARSKFNTYATDTRLDTPRFQSCLKAHSGRTEVSRQMKAGEAAFLTGTPTVYLNGIKLEQMSPEETQAVLAVTTAHPSAAEVISRRLKPFR